MTQSLSVLLPVHNVQSTLQASVQQLLDVLPELTNRFEIVVVDDGSTDATCEVAYEMARNYPQLKVVRRSSAIGWAAAVAKQAIQTNGEYIMIHCGGKIVADEWVGLWRLRDGIAAATLAKAKAAQAGKSLRIDPKVEKESKLRKNTVEHTKFLNGMGIHARAPQSSILLVHRQQLAQLEQGLRSLGSSTQSLSASKNSASSATAAGSGQVNRPSFLSRLKSFALDE